MVPRANQRNVLRGRGSRQTDSVLSMVALSYLIALGLTFGLCYGEVSFLCSGEHFLYWWF
jgi:hypothetical protein